MPRTIRLVRPLALMLAAIACTAWAAAQPAPRTPSEAYLGYRAALGKAASLDELRPWFSKDGLAKLDGMPKDQRATMLGMVKEMSGAITNVKVVKETITGDRALLQVEGIDAGYKTKARATVEVVREGGVWKFVKERWGG